MLIWNAQFLINRQFYGGFSDSAWFRMGKSKAEMILKEDFQLIETKKC